MWTARFVTHLLLFVQDFRYVAQKKKQQHYWDNVGRYLVNNSYYVNFVVTILVPAVIEGGAERIYADSDVDSATSIAIVAAAVRCIP